MSKVSLVLSWLFKIAAMGLTVLLVIQIYDTVTKENRFLFFQLIFIFVWGIGALVLWIVGISVGKSYKKGNEE